MSKPLDDAAVADICRELRGRDEKLALDFLAGVVKIDRHGLPTLTYLPIGSKEEEAARAALVRLLMERELSSRLCDALALLFDAKVFDQVVKSCASPGEQFNARYRKIVFKHKGRGAPSKEHRRFTIAAMILRDINSGTKPEQAKKRAADTYGLSMDAIKSILKEFGPLFSAG
jgi:hypothetical protein